jgi:uncharacterized protein DUF2188
MAKRKVVDVKPSRDVGEDVKPRTGGGGSHYETKAPAIKQAKRIAKSADLGQVVIRRANNRSRQSTRMARIHAAARDDRRV